MLSVQQNDFQPQIIMFSFSPRFTFGSLMNYTRRDSVCSISVVLVCMLYCTPLAWAFQKSTISAPFLALHKIMSYRKQGAYRMKIY